MLLIALVALLGSSQAAPPTAAVAGDGSDKPCTTTGYDIPFIIDIDAPVDILRADGETACAIQDVEIILIALERIINDLGNDYMKNGNFPGEHVKNTVIFLDFVPHDRRSFYC